MKILFYDTKVYDKESFEGNLKEKYKNIEIDFLEGDINEATASLALGYDAVCVFVASPVDSTVLKILARCSVKLVLLRCAG
jgi:D-lactate dehydrogenase